MPPNGKKRGVTLTCDGWTSLTKLNFINVLIYSNGFTVLNASDVQRKDANYLFKLIKKVIKKVGAEKVVPIVTDNTTPMNAGGNKLMEESHVFTGQHVQPIA